MKVGKSVDSTQNSIFAKFQKPISCSFCGAEVQKNTTNGICFASPPLEIIVTCILYKLQISY